MMKGKDTEPRREPHYEGFITIYEKWIAESVYADEVMARLMPLLDGAESMIDIGAGTGVFCFRVPPHIAVTAVETTSMMRRYIAERAKEKGRDVCIVAHSWEQTDVPERSYDIALSANSIYRMEPLEENLSKMMRTARQAVMIVMNGRDIPGVYGRMRQALRVAGIPCRKPPLGHTLDDVKHALDALGAAYEVELVSWTDVVRFADEKEAMRYLETKLGVWISSESTAVLMPYFEKDDDGFVINDEITMAFLTIRV